MKLRDYTVPPVPRLPRKRTTHYVLIKPWAVYVKDAAFFVKQGGLSQPWGRNWRGVHATDIEDARRYGERLREAWSKKP